jgi:diguanylate cyclase (GGDEF)-like protein/PAS domain S-box-containing protein
MFIRMLDCLTVDHSPSLVVLSIAVALLSGFTFYRVLGHARMRDDHGQIGWSLMAAFVAGGGIWATHFIAVLGFQPATRISYDVALTLISALQAMTFAALATLLLLSKSPIAALAGALVLGAAIGIMHFTGMRALVFSGSLEWDPMLVALSLAMGSVLAVASIFVERSGPSLIQSLAATVLFGAAICVLHFTSMEAAVLKLDPSQAARSGNLSAFLLGLAVAVVAGAIVIFSLVTVMFDRRAHQATTEARRMRSILESTQIGILVCQGDTIISANKTFRRLADAGDSTIEGRKLCEFLDLPVLDHRKPRLHDVETEMLTDKGTSVDVAVSTAPVRNDGTLSHLIEVRDIGEQKRASRDMLHLVNHDALTGLPNRRLLHAELRTEAEFERPFALLWIDLDRFKQVNDTHGHAIGDALLRDVALRLRSVLDSRHLLARVGGDEFVVLFRPEPGVQDPAQAAADLVNAMADSFIIEEKVLQVGASIGLASYPEDAVSAEDLMRKADAALYHAKKTGRSRWYQAA